MNLSVKPHTRPVTLKSRAKALLLLFGDIFIFYASLLLMLFIRNSEFSIHIIPFSIALMAWLIIFYIGGLYEPAMFRNSPRLTRQFLSLLGLGGIFLIMLLYFVPQFGIAPKANFFLFMLIYAGAGFAWRFLFNTLLRLRVGGSKNRVLLVGSSDTANEIAAFLADNRQFDYEIVGRDLIPNLVTSDISTIVIPSQEYEPETLRLLYAAFLSGKDVIRLADFYEQILSKVPLSEIDEAWLLQNVSRSGRSYQIFRYLLESIFAFILAIVFLPFMALVALLIIFTSQGPALYTQKRVGQYDKEFNVYKFRSMYADATRNPDAGSSSPTWSTQDDSRVTPLGKFLRATHIDEFPQLFNILSGSMSFIGPRPERPEFTEKLEKAIPYYELRNLLKPGITGWAQLNYGYGSSVDDAYHKLQYDIYYVKNRSLSLDLRILLKTLKKFFV